MIQYGSVAPTGVTVHYLPTHSRRNVIFICYLWAGEERASERARIAFTMMKCFFRIWFEVAVAVAVD